jgi:PST family polysaccharide transporter
MGALLQGFRRVADQAKVQVFSGALATAFAIGAILLLGVEGVVIFVVTMPFATLILTWLYSRRIEVRVRLVAFRPFVSEARKMIALGVTVMAVGAIAGWLDLALRSRITQSLGLDAVGIFQAAWALSVVYMGFVLDAMTKDFYPHLTQKSHDRSQSVQLIREQINVALVLLAPIVVIAVAFAPFLVVLFYSSKFSEAAFLIQLMGLGNLLKAVSLPLSFIVLAQGRSRLFFTLKMNWFVFFMGPALYFVDDVGLVAVGWAFFFANLIQLILVYVVARILVGFSFEKQNLVLSIKYGIIIFMAFFVAVIDKLYGYVIGSISTIALFWISYKNINKMLGVDVLDLLREKALFRRTT